MIELLFIELGAVVTEILGPKKCTVEPFCDLAKPPTFGAEGRVEVDLALSVEGVLMDRGSLESVAIAARKALYDQHDQMKNLGGEPIGWSWPGGGYEGILSVHEDVVKANATLAAAVATLPGQRWEYQVVVSIDEATGKVWRRYHGFHAEIIQDEGDVLVLEVADAGKSADPSTSKTTVRYNPADTTKFYTGKLVAENLVRGGPSPRRSGAVFIALEQLATGGPSVPKLPPDASSTEVDRRVAPGRPLTTGIIVGAQRTVTAITADPLDGFQRFVKDVMEIETDWPITRSNDIASVKAQRKQQVHDLFDGAECVDLVGHSTPIKGYLKLGDWVLDPGEAERLASYMPPSVKSVRLIGCATAKTSDGRAAAEAIARRGLSAYGTINNVYTTHFDKNGVKRGTGAPGLRAFLPSGPPARPSPSPVPPAEEASSLPGAEGASRPWVEGGAPPVFGMHAPGLGLAVPGLLTWLGRCAWSVIAAPFAVLLWLVRRLFAKPEVPHRWISWLLSPVSTAMPGLLTEPLLIYEIKAGWEIWTLEILFDFECARFYSSTDSDAKKERVYKIRGSARDAKTMLEAYLPETALRGAEVKDRVALRRRHKEAGERGGSLEPSPIETQAPGEMGELSRSGSLASTG